MFDMKTMFKNQIKHNLQKKKTLIYLIFEI